MDVTVQVIGSGPAGLACAAALLGRGISAAVLEQGPAVGTAWADRYDALRLNTSRVHSALAGAPFPRAWGQFPTRDQYVRYLRDYAARHGIPVRTGIRVCRLDPVGRAWRIRTRVAEDTIAHPHGADGPGLSETRTVDRAGCSELTASHVVIATGIWNRPVMPGWAPADDPAVLHSSAYRNATPFRGQNVVVVGTGSTGLDIAHELARGGAQRVSLAVRTPPNILYRQVGRIPLDLPVPLLLHLPPRLVDAMFGAMQVMLVGDLSAFGLPRPAEGPMAALRRGAAAAVVDPDVIESIRDGAIRVVPEAVGLSDAGVRLRDGGEVRADAVILAAGFRTGLEPVVGHLDVLTERGMPRIGDGREALPGLRFAGYVHRPGITGFVARHARRVARELAARA